MCQNACMFYSGLLMNFLFFQMVSLSPSVSGGLGNILDSAVKTAVTHLASSQEGIDRSRVDFLYYDSGSPPYYDYYYDDHTYLDSDIPPVVTPTDGHTNNYSPPDWTKHVASKETRWTGEEQQKYPSPPDDQRNPPPRPHHPPNNHLDRRVDRQSSIFSLSTITSYLPFLVILPVIAAASYYLIVQNGPTPVVKEKRGSKQVDWVKEVPRELVMNTLSNTHTDHGQEDVDKFHSLIRRQSRLFTPSLMDRYSKQLKVNK